MSLPEHLRITRGDLDRAADAGLLQEGQAGALWHYLRGQVQTRYASDEPPRFSFTHVLYYLGGLIAIGAMSVFMTLGWTRFGGWGVFFIALLYSGIAWKLARRFEVQGQAIPMGIMATLIVVLVPLATWALQQALGYWPEVDGVRDSYRAYHARIDWRWLTLELATLAAGAGLLYRWRAPFMLMPIAATLWYLSMDLALLILDPGVSPGDASAWIFRKWFSVAFGAATMLFALLVDLRNRSRLDYAFWLYLFGLLSFWVGLTSLGSQALSGKLIYLAINLALVLLGAVLGRRTFTVFGALGVALVLGDISRRYFQDSWLFPIALSLIGLAIVYAGFVWSRHEVRLTAHLRAMLPRQLQDWLARRAVSMD
jgi:hypothetical protein